MSQRVPRDLNFAWAPLPTVFEDLGGAEWARAATRLAEPGGWPNVLVAGWLQAIGRSGAAFTLATVPWTALLLVATAALAWRGAGAWGAVAGVAWVAQVPVLVLATRDGWVHGPEAALVATAAALLVADPGLARRRTAAGLAVAGALAIALRPSGLGWIGLVGLAAIAGWTGRRPERWGHVVVVAAAWAIAALAPLPLLRGYLAGKAAVRERYAVEVAGLAPQLAVHLGVVAAALLGVSVVAAVVARGSATGPRPDAGALDARDRRLRAALLAGWLAVPFVLAAASRAGLDNFLLLYVGLGVVAARGLGTRVRGRPVLAWIAVVALVLTSGARLAADLAPTAPAPPRVATLLDETCPRRGPKKPCLLVADQGLYFPGSEEPGRLELFLLREDAVRFVSLHRPQMAAAAAAVATWECPADPYGHRPGADRTPGRQAAMAQLVAARKLAPAWSGPLEGCTFTWWTPGGR